MAAEVDRTRPQNHELIINEKGEPALKRLRAKATPANLAQLEEALAERIPERHLLDVLARIDHITNFTRHFGPLSGSEPKTPHARERHLLTIFTYGSHFGPHQMARHLKGLLTADQIIHLNHRHFTVTNLDAAQRDIINRFHRFTLPHYWGDEKRAAADGTQYELAEENLLAEKHIRYGGFGGIAYHHVSDLYILLFSHFVACGTCYLESMAMSQVSHSGLSVLSSEKVPPVNQARQEIIPPEREAEVPPGSPDGSVDEPDVSPFLDDPVLQRRFHPSPDRSSADVQGERE